MIRIKLYGSTKSPKTRKEKKMALRITKREVAEVAVECVWIVS